jgi:TIR domain
VLRLSGYTLRLQTAFFVHAAADHQFAKQLAEFLESGCELTCFVDDGLVRKGSDLISKAEEGLCAEVLVLLLSPASCQAPWVRERWEPVLFGRAKQERVEVVTVLLNECTFPALLRRRNFIDATANWVLARRLLKRWFWLSAKEPGARPSLEISDDLEDLYLTLADRPSTMPIRGAHAWRFAKEAAEEFEAVLWVPCYGRTLAQAAGALSHQLGLTLDGPVLENCIRIREVLAEHRCLVVLDGPDAEASRELTAGGRTSTAVTSDAVKIFKTPETPAYARDLIATRRFAEAYELLYRLLDAVIDPDNCARELTWICEHWERVEEANVLRLNYGQPGMEQLTLF